MGQVINRRSLDNETKTNKITTLLNDMVVLRKKCSKSKNNNLKKALDVIQSECTKELEYLVEARTRRYRGFANYEDLRQDGRIALYRALQTYIPEKGDFFWWANKYIKTKISREANRHSTIKVPLKHAKTMQPYKVSQLPVIIDVGPSALESIASDESAVLIRNAVEKLPEDQRRVIKLHYEMGGGTDNRRELFSIGKICDKLNISRMNCVKLLNEAKKTLKRELVDLF
jgi:RNA polymerase sigma factor (sigma-70 family)